MAIPVPQACHSGMATQCGVAMEISRSTTVQVPICKHNECSAWSDSLNKMAALLLRSAHAIALILAMLVKVASLPRYG